MYHYHEKAKMQIGENAKMIEKEKYLNRVTICISSQVGCPVGCIFCVTGKL
jgi:adenine C2-methylase RlmN of 23S rRNA A2503 and tRNA A37